MSIDFNTQIALEQGLADMAPVDQIEWLKQFLINMMDWTEQTDIMEVYYQLHLEAEDLAEVFHERQARRESTQRGIREEMREEINLHRLIHKEAQP